MGLFLEVQRAVQHAHRRGVIHRYLNLANILVATRNGELRPGLRTLAAQGSMYLIEDGPNRLFRINLATGAATEIGGTGAASLVGIPRGSNIARRDHGCGAAEIEALGRAALGGSFTVQRTALRIAGPAGKLFREHPLHGGAEYSPL